MRGRGAVAASLVAWLAAAPAAAETARGVVFDDRDGDGVRGAAEPGVPGVRVSDGRRVVRSDAGGRWSLEIGDAAIVFVTKPAGWMTRVDPVTQLPRFYYIHQPGGSPPGLRYAGIEPTGSLPDSIDFPLRRVDEPARFEAILFADTQPQTAVEVDMVRDDVVAGLVGTDARFGMTLGDILFDDLSLFPRFNRVIGQIGIPWYNVPGNHELNLLAADDRHSLETFKRTYGPPYYAFEVGDAVFFVLDNIEYQGNGTADPADVRGAGGYEARLGEQQLEWLERELAHVPAEKLVFLAMHAPLRTYLHDLPRANTQDRRDLFRLLEGREHLYAVAGHSHTTEHHYFGRDDGFPGPGELHHHVLTTVSGSWWSGPLDARGIADATQRDGTPNGYHVLEVDGVELAVRYRAAGMSADHQMRIVFDVAHHQHRPEALRDYRHGELLDGRFPVDAVPAAQVVVNLFDGGPRSRVSFEVGGRPPVEMQRVSYPDPWVHELYGRNRETVKSWVKAEPSSHLWTADLPDDLGPGTYTLTVRATDEFGRVHHGHRILEIEGSSGPRR
ncbi:MAG: calcineurin-like phosphoesterase family protein [Myxococcota bacterium]|nr:calcineurin-like phosphoesterase family protein [Myxococcota bacterium]